MKAYYNEFDSFPAQWLRNLIDAGLIALGDIDERSIEDVTAVDLAGYDRCHFFAGIAGWERALQLAGWPESWPVWTGSCPCQPFSSAGKGGRGADERHLWPAWFHLIRVCRPPVIFGEQVASKDGLKWLDLVCSDLEAEGYAVGAADLCAAGVGAPHIRQRIWFCALGNSDSSKCKTWQPVSIGTEQRPECATQPSPTLLLGHAGDPRCEGDGLQPLRREGEGGEPDSCPARPSPVISLGQPENGGCEGNLLYKIQGRRNRKRPLTDAARPSPTGELANPSSQRQHRRVQDGINESAEVFGAGCEIISPMAHPNGGMCHRGQHQPEREAQGRVVDDGVGEIGNFWSDCQWLPCRDGRWRPTKPGLSPLAHGVPQRVGRLRAAGNAISPQVAAEFIKAVMEVMNCNQ